MDRFVPALWPVQGKVRAASRPTTGSMDTLDELEVEEPTIHTRRKDKDRCPSPEVQCPQAWPREVHALRATCTSTDHPANGSKADANDGRSEKENRFHVDEIPEEVLEDLFEAPLLLPTQNAPRMVQNATRCVHTPSSSPLGRISNLPPSRKTPSKGQEGEGPKNTQEEEETRSKAHAPSHASNVREPTEPTSVATYIPGPAGVLQRAKEMGLHSTILGGVGNEQDGTEGDEGRREQDPVLNSPSWRGAIHSSGRLSGCIGDVLGEGKPTRISRMLVYIAHINVSMEGGAFLRLRDAAGSMDALLEKEALSAHEDYLTQGSVVLLENVVAVRVSEFDMVLCILKENVANIHTNRPALPPSSSAMAPRASVVVGDGMR